MEDAGGGLRSLAEKKGKQHMADCVVRTGNRAGLNVREAQSKRSRKLGVIENGVTINVVRCNSDWATLLYRGTPAFVQMRYLAHPPVVNGEGLWAGDTAVCNAKRVAICDAANGKESGKYLERDARVTVSDQALADGGYWYRIGKGQWVLGAALTPSGEQADDEDTCAMEAVVETKKHGTGGALHLRAEASGRARVVAAIPNGATICVESLEGTWLPARYGAYTGYVKAQFVAGSEAYQEKEGTDGTAPSGGAQKPDTPDQSVEKPGGLPDAGETLIPDKEPDQGNETQPPQTPGTSGEDSTMILYVFSAEQAVTYALNHSDNSKSGPCPLRNRIFRISDGKNDCADFVHQCICAGGVPMFDGWFYRLPGIPSGWANSKWALTHSGLEKLKGKGWIYPVAYDAVQPGDLIYTYKANAKPTPYTHVTLAVSGNVTENGKFGCRVCGYTANQHDAFKQLTEKNCECYRVYPAFAGDGTEKKVYLPLTGSGGYVLSPETADDDAR